LGSFGNFKKLSTKVHNIVEILSTSGFALAPVVLAFTF
jgi:hypothetical protein